MLEFLKGILKKEEAAPRYIPIEEIPSWLDGEEKRALLDLETRNATSRNRIEALRKSLLQQAKALTFPEEKRHLHPKLERIAISTLPMFERSITQALVKPFPEGTDEFYTAATECLKNSLRAVQGQGRYLQAVFPEEMKAIRATLRDFGGEINAMTESMKTHRDRADRIASIRDVYDALIEIRDNKSDAGNRSLAIQRRIANARDAIRALKNERREIENGTDYWTYAGLQKEVSTLEHDQERTLREFTVLSGAVSHVFRKAEKVAGRKGDPGAAKAVSHANSILSDHDVPVLEDLAAGLRGAMPIVLPLIVSGEVPLKNKEERALFADAEHLSRILEQNAAEYHSLSSRLAAARENCAKSPAASRLNQIGIEFRQHEKTIERGELQIAEAARQQKEAAGAVPTLAAELDHQIAAHTGGRIRLQTALVISTIENREKSV